MHRDRPILMSAPMVRALLAGAKTQTRRIVKPPNWAKRNNDSGGEAFLRLMDGEQNDPHPGRLCGLAATGTWHPIGCPYGVPGDHLWVRETWGYTRQCDDINGPGDVVAYAAGHPWHVYEDVRGKRRLRESTRGTIMEPNHWCDQPAKWTPSIHMPRWASRLTLEITDVRVQRLQEISEEDAWAEGIERTGANAAEIARNATGDRSILVASVLTDGYHNFASAREAYAFLWDEINGAGSWDANPWCWCISFRRRDD